MSQFRTTLINRVKVKQLLLEQAEITRAHKFTRVSSATINDANEALRQWCVNRVKGLPSMGKTI